MILFRTFSSLLYVSSCYSFPPWKWRRRDWGESSDCSPSNIRGELWWTFGTGCAVLESLDCLTHFWPLSSLSRLTSQMRMAGVILNDVTLLMGRDRFERWFLIPSLRTQACDPSALLWLKLTLVSFARCVPLQGCRGKGFFCDHCRDKVDLLFPFSANTSSCAECGTVYHRSCYHRKHKMCTKCQRMKQKLQKSCISEEGEEEHRIREPQRQQQQQQREQEVNTDSGPAGSDDQDEGQQQPQPQGVNPDERRDAAYCISSYGASATTEANEQANKILDQDAESSGGTGMSQHQSSQLQWTPLSSKEVPTNSTQKMFSIRLWYTITFFLLAASQWSKESKYNEHFYFHDLVNWVFPFGDRKKVGTYWSHCLCPRKGTLWHLAHSGLLKIEAQLWGGH